MIIQLDFDGRWTDISKAFCRLLGYTREEVLASSPDKMIHAEDFQAFWQNCQ